MAFAIAAEVYIFPRPILVGLEGSTSGELDRGKLGPIDLTSQNRAYYFFALGVLVLVLLLVGHLRRTGIGRAIIGVRENETGAAAFTVSPTRAKLTAFALAGFLAGLGGAMLAGSVQVFDYTNSFFRVQDSLVDRRDGRHRRARQPRGCGDREHCGSSACPCSGRRTRPSRCSRRASGCSSCCSTSPAASPNSATRCAARSCAGSSDACRNGPPRPSPRRRCRCRSRATAPPPTNDDGSALRTLALSVEFGGLVAVDAVDFHAMPGEVIGLIGTNGAGKSTLLNAIGGYVPSRGHVELLGDDVSHFAPAPAGPGRSRPHVPGRRRCSPS